MKTLQDVKTAYNNREYDNKLDYEDYFKSKLKDNHVENEFESVNWNREYVIEYNKKVYELKQKYREESSRLHTFLVSDILEALKNDYPEFSEEQLKTIYVYVYSEFHGNGFNDIFSYLEEIIDLFLKVISIEK